MSDIPPPADAVHPVRHASPKSKPSVALNVTSMVDILFNLLVYFIVTANFAMDEGALKAKLPPREAPGPVVADPEIEGGKHFLDLRGVRGSPVCQLFLDGKSVPDFAALRAMLAARNAKTAKAGGFGAGLIQPEVDSIVIRPAPGVRWQHVANAFNQVVGTGYAKVGFGAFAGE